MDNSKVAIVLVNYNGFLDTRECVESILKIETNYNYCIIVVDNASPNESAEMLEMYAKKNGIVFLAEKENKGYAEGA